jgi:hypothetical protein
MGDAAIVDIGDLNYGASKTLSNAQKAIKQAFKILTDAGVDRELAVRYMRATIGVIDAGLEPWPVAEQATVHSKARYGVDRTKGKKTPRALSKAVAVNKRNDQLIEEDFNAYVAGEREEYKTMPAWTEEQDALRAAWDVIRRSKARRPASK